MKRLHVFFLIVIMAGSMLLMAQIASKRQLFQEDIGMVNCHQYGAASNLTTLNACLAGLAGANKIAFLPPGTWTISGAVTIPVSATLWIPAGTTVNVSGSSTLTVNGALHMDSGSTICPGVGSTVNILGPIDAPIQAIFCQTGTVSFVNNSKVTNLYPQWWGAIVDDAQDDTVAIRAAINAGSHHTVYFPPGTYLISSTIFVDTPHSVHLTAAGYIGATLQRADSMSGDVFVFRVGNCEVSHLYFFDSGTDTTRLGGAIYLSGTSLSNRAGFMKIDDITVSSSAAGGAWEYALFANGSGLRVSGTAGIRDLFVSNSSFFGVRTPGKTIYLNTCVNCFFTNIGIFPAPTAIIGGIEVRGWDGSVNWSSDVHFMNVHGIGDAYLEGQFISWTGGSISSSSATPITIPSTSSYIQVNTITSFLSSGIVNAGTGSYVFGHETPAGSTTQHSTFPTNLDRIPGFVITGSGAVDDYQGITRVTGAVGSNPVSRLMSGVLGGGSDWEFGVTNNYAAGVSTVSFVVDWLGAHIKPNASLRFDGATLAQLPLLIGNAHGTLASAGMTWCTDCAQGTNPCSAGGGSFAIHNGANWKCPVWP